MENIMLRRLSIINEKIQESTVSALKHSTELTDIDDAEVCINKLETAINRFSTELLDYFRLCTEPSADDISSFSEIQLKGEEVLAELKVKVKRVKEERINSVTSKEKHTVLSGKLPKLNLPEFSGEILEWHQFWDQFESNIGSRNLSDVDKLLYLKSSLKGDAKKAIDGFETTNKNYEIAVLTLKNRYGKVSHIIDAHYAALYRIDKVSIGKNITVVRNTFNEIERHLRVLQSLGEDINHNHLRFLILEKFPEDIIYDLKMKVSTESIDEMRRHLEIIISAREDANRMAGENANRNTQENQKEDYTTQSLQANAYVRKGNFKKFNQNFRNNKTRERGQNFNENKNKEILGKRNIRGHNQEFGRNLKRKHEQQEKNRRIPQFKRRRPQCIFCQGSHYSDECKKVKSLQERKDKLKKRCFGCLMENHSIRDCKKPIYCVHCKESGKHHRAICPKICPKETEKTNALHMNTLSLTVLQTAIVKIQNENLQCRALLDSGSQRTYITKALATKLNLPSEEEIRLSVFTFGSSTPQTIESEIVKLQVQTLTNNTLVLYANVVPHISHGVPYPDVELGEWKNNLTLADDGSLSSQIDILIGNDYYFSLISNRKIKLDENLFLIESKFGWILTGKLNTKNVDDLSAVTYFQTSLENKLTHPDLPLEKGDLKCLWSLESIGICDSPKVSRDEETIKHFNDTIELINNRYTVSWPWIEYPPNLPSNFGLAFGRLVNLLKRLDSEMLSSYEDTLQEQLKKGIIEIIPEEEIGYVETDHPIHYIPHQGIAHPEKPLRIVYDASAKTKDNKSLNECLHCGPLLLEDLVGMFLRFRSHPIGITADVEKAFLQIALHENDKDVTRFLWLRDATKPATKDNLLHLRFCRVPFGIISSPFLLNATLKHHLLSLNEDTLKQITNDIYVDNLVTGCNTTQEAITLYKKCKETFKEISMNLREWSSNSKEFMKNISSKDICKDTVIKVLGLIWNTKKDTIHLKPKKIKDANTKREILKNIASIYDPCGYAVPELLAAKIFLQKLWIEKFDWDTRLPTNLANEWLEIAADLENTQDVNLSRTYFKDRDNKDIQLHCFTDASIKAYAAVVYITNTKEISFVIGKSRLVPIKDHENLKIPRLELLGVLIGSRLINYVIKFLHFDFKKIIIWTDSQIVIDWYHSSKLLPPFISRRIEEIKKNASITIRYVPTQLNPADVATRPTTSEEEKKRWLSGPNFLLDDSKTWPTSRRSDLSFSCGEDLPNNKEKRLKQRNPIQKHVEQNVSMEPSEEDSTLTQEIKRIQLEFFSEELEGKETSLKRNLGLFIDSNGILRCKGRLKNADWSYDKKYPILIPKDCDFTTKLILSTHEKNYHVGVNHTLSIIRRSYWIPQGRSLVQRILKKCTNCIKHGGGPFKLPPTPALPKERVNYSSPFTYTGVDYLGPLCVRNNSKTEKRWICLYTCLAIRAIHLEVVKDLTAEECVLALRRFISSRGVPAIITSDNAPQFKLTAEVLSSNYCIKNEIKWKFIPQLAPWHGGFYERLVGLVKHCFKRTLIKHLLTDNQLTTVMKEIEAVLNTRPLTCVGSDVEDVLRPSDFLTMGKCIVTESSDQVLRQEGTVTKQNLIESWRRSQITLSEFKKMFIDQYLPSLRERYHHSHKEPRITKSEVPKLGDVVQIKGDTKNRENWMVGKIIALLKGADGQCRVARVQVGESEFARSISHLYPLEVDRVPETEKSTYKHKESNNEPMEIDLPLTTRTDSTFHPEDMQVSASNIPETDDEPVIEENTVRDEVTPPQQEILEAFDDPVMETEEIECIPESTETKEKDHIPEMREKRNASVKAREKIREWTRDLMDLL